MSKKISDFLSKKKKVSSLYPPLRGSPIRPSTLIRVDCIAGATVDVLVLSFRGWLAELYALPADLLQVMGLANLVYACVSFTLARLSRGDRIPLLRAVALANITWAVACAVLTVVNFGQASAFGITSLLGEALFVGGLGICEWRAAVLSRGRQASLPESA